VARKPLKLNVNPLFQGPTLETRTQGVSPYREIKINDIDVDPNQPRKLFDTESIKLLSISIEEHGVLCPLLVTVSESGTFKLIAGERRLRAAKLAGLKSVPAVVTQEDAEGASNLAKQLVENMHRKDLSPMERALAIGELKDQYGLSIREISKRVGTSKSMVQRSLEVLELPEDLQEALIKGKSESKVLLLSKIENAKERKKLLKEINSLSREQLEARIEELLGEEEVSHGGTPRKEKTKAARLSTEDRRLVEEIQRSLGTKVQISRKRGKGKLTIEFYNPEDLYEIYRKLTA